MARCSQPWPVRTDVMSEARMQPTGRSGEESRPGAALRWRAKERRFVRARAWGPAADAQFVRLTQDHLDVSEG